MFVILHASERPAKKIGAILVYFPSRTISEHAKIRFSIA